MKLFKGFFLVLSFFFLLFLSFSKDEALATCDPPSVKILEDGSIFTSIQSAYVYASDRWPDFTLLLTGGIFTEDLILNGGSVVFDGGYDCSFSTKNLTTGIFGTVTITSGSLNLATVTGGVGIVSTDQCDFDSDFDGYTSIGSCAGSADDCNDNDLAINPGAIEVCDGIDNNCDGQIDEGATGIDADGDGYYAIGSCGEAADDCNDYVFSINPGAVEISYDGIDQDCNGVDLTFAEDNLLQQQNCGICHGILPTQWDNVHASVPAPDGTCAACHAAPVSNILPGHYGQTVRTAGNNMAAGSTIICNSCHDQVSAEHNFGANIVMAKVFAAWPNNLSCDSCHDNRVTLHATDLAHDNRIIDNMCSICHTSDTTLLGSPGNGTLANSANVDTLHRSDCTLCHNYTGTIVDVGTVRQEIQQGLEGSLITCTDCHTNKGNESNHHGTGISGVGCVECHGHDTGSLVDADTQTPYTVGTVASQGRGTTQSHSTHTELTGADAKGPGIYCDTCHDIWDFPYFKSGIDIDGNGRFTLAETDVCDACHSGGGSYDGLEDAAVGAKLIWSTGAYDSTESSSLREGKEKWCATCHDESPPVISSVAAPNVIGDEDGDFIYGTGWGYYMTGHGLESGKNYPSKGGIVTLSGRPVECDSCHDYATSHIDGVARTFDDGDVKGLDPVIYRQGYRLKLIDGEEPYWMPRHKNTGTTGDQFKVCFQVGCHDSGPFTDSANMNTNLITDGGNKHTYHLFSNNDGIAAADWSGTYNSRMTCVVCHNVHGSTQLAMVRDGKLIDREIGSWIWYKNDATTVFDTSNSKPVPEDLPLSASDGTIWNSGPSNDLCATCHAGGIRTGDRIPFQDVAQAPLLEWVGTNGLTSDGVVPDNALGNSTFTFRVSYSDINNDSPNPIEVWVDLNDNGSYESGEKFGMAGTNISDTNTFNGKTYTKSLPIARAVESDGILIYRFYASDGALVAGGEPITNRTLTVTNNDPVLTWTAESYFETDGVHPNIGGNGSDYQFRVTYTDADGECPPEPNNGDIQVVVDGVAYNLDNNDGAACDTGRVYSTARPVSSSSPPQDLVYSFTATDGTGEAVGNPTLNNTLTIQAGGNNPPQLDWVTESCLSDGVKPALGLATGDFEFKVRYMDPDGDAPISFKVWVDLNDNNTVEAGEEHDLTWVNDGDEDYTDGEVFSYTWTISEADAGVHEFVFLANDGDKNAVGEPTETDLSRTVTIVSTAAAVGVRQGLGDLGPVWYSSIQAAIDPSGSVDPDARTTILVFEGTYNENVTLDRFGFPRDNHITLQSVCGPELTVIQGRDDDDNGEPDGIAVYFNEVTNPVIDGFTISHGTEGVVLFHSSATVKNCIIEGNGGGISSPNDIGLLTLEDSTIQNNISTGNGAGINLFGGSAQHTISRSVIKNNQTTGAGGGICLFNSGSGKGIAIEESTISSNTASSGGGIYMTRSVLDLEKVILSSNTAASGGGLFVKENSTVNMINSTVVDNSADSEGGGIRIWCANDPGFLNMTNCTVSNNNMTDPEAGSGGGLYTNGGHAATVSMNNSIFWGNRAGSGNEVSNNTSGTISFTWSDVPKDSHALSGGGSTTTDATCLATDPFFIDSVNGDYHLLPIFSPVIDQGTATGVPVDDLDGNARSDGSPDMGAYEASP
jgi:protein-arginine kinase activator protein McsA